MRTLLIMTLAVPGLFAVENHSTETRTFQGSHLVILDNVTGSVEATGYNGNDVQVEYKRTVNAESDERLAAADREVKLDIQQSGDTLKLYVNGPFRNCCGNGSRHNAYEVRYDFKLRVPMSARLDLYTVNGGKVAVNNTTGDFDISNVNSGIELTGIAGSGKAHTVNGPIRVVYTSNPRSATSFETVNGPVDLTFRPGLAANVHMQTLNGGMFTDYEVQALPEAEMPEKRNGKFVFHRGGKTAVRIGAGGPELNLKTLNGDIYIRDREKK